MEKEIPAVVPDFKLRPAPSETTTNQPNVESVKRFITDLLSLDMWKPSSIYMQGFSAVHMRSPSSGLCGELCEGL